jgi:hypothetical protein
VTNPTPPDTPRRYRGVGGKDESRHATAGLSEVPTDAAAALLTLVAIIQNGGEGRCPYADRLAHLKMPIMC